MKTTCFLTIVLSLSTLGIITSSVLPPFTNVTKGGTIPENRTMSSLTYATAGSVSVPSSLYKPDRAKQARIVESYGKLPMSFEANSGQTDSQVKFLSRGNGYTLFLTPKEAVISLIKQVGHDSLDSSLAIPSASKRKSVKSERAAVKMTFVQANQEPEIMGVDAAAGKSNYFIGNVPNNWRTNIPTYGKVKYENIYRGIDAIFYGDQQELEYDLIVNPSATPSDIILQFEGAESITVDGDGSLVLHTEGGEIRQRRPYAYQDIDGGRREVQASYAILEHKQVAFEVRDYDSSNTLIIDPVLMYSTYLGPTTGDSNTLAIAIDPLGNAYVTGTTNSSTFPITMGAFQPSIMIGGPCSGTCGEAFVAKLDSSGSTLLFSTYIGGRDMETGRGITVDSAGNSYITGSTQSNDYPATPGAFQRIFGGDTDAFVTKLNPTGSALIYSTYLGGAREEDGYSISVDSLGNSYVCGGTDSVDFPLMTPLQAGKGGTFDGFVTKLNSSGSSLVFSTYFGGNGDELAVGIGTDPTGNVYVAGRTFSSAFPLVNAAQPTWGGNLDAFAAKLNSAGTALVYSTYIGGSGGEVAGGLAVDLSGNAYVIGETASSNFPTTAGAVQTIRGGGESDAFVTKLGPTGSIIYSTYMGGSAQDVGTALACDSAGNAYIVGTTKSIDFPLVAPIQSRFGGGLDGFLAKLNADGSTVLYSTFLGGGEADLGGAFPIGIAVDSFHNAYITGNTDSANIPILSAFQPTKPNRGSCAFLMRISDAPPNQPPIASCRDITRSATSNCNVSVSPHEIDNGSSDPDGDNITFSLSPPGPYSLGTTIVTFTVTDAHGASSQCAATVTVNDNTPPIPNAASLPTVIQQCSATVTPPTATDNCAGTIAGTTTDPLTYTSQGSFLVHWTYNDGHGNSSHQTQMVVVQDTTPPTITTCAASKTLSASASCQAPIPNLIGEVAATDNCSSVTITQTPPAGTLVGIGNTPVTIGVRDAVGNESTCIAMVTVVDATPPTITCPGPIVRNNDPNQCSAVATFQPNVGDNCSGVTTNCVPPSSSVFPVGTTTVTCTVNDGAHNQTRCSFTVTVRDAQPPVITCPANIVVPNAAGQCSASVSVGPATATDNCSVASIVGVRSDALSISSAYPVGVTTIVWTARDAAANQASCAQTITVNDTEAPVITGGTANPSTLWPPNHKMVDVTISYGVTDNCTPSAAIVCDLTVSSNEPPVPPGDPHSSTEWTVIDTHHLQLRSERDGGGSGRIYMVTISCRDSKGDTATKLVTVTVPHNQ